MSKRPVIEWHKDGEDLIGSDGMGIVVKINSDDDNEYRVNFTIYASEDTPSSDVPLAAEAAARTLRKYLGMD